jgi:hypothetical protein
MMAILPATEILRIVSLVWRLLFKTYYGDGRPDPVQRIIILIMISSPTFK